MLLNEENKNNIKLTDIVDLKFLQEFQDGFAKSVNVSSIIIDDEGPITNPSNYNDFCTKALQKGCNACSECIVKSNKFSTKNKKIIIDNCNAGFTNFAAPIMLNEKQIATIIGGQILTHEPKGEQFKQLAKELKINDDEYIEAIKKLKIASHEQTQSASELLLILANTISELANKNYGLLIKKQRDELLNKTSELLIKSSFDLENFLDVIVYEIADIFSVDRVAVVEFKDKTNFENHTILKEYKKDKNIKSPSEITNYQKNGMLIADYILNSGEYFIINNINESTFDKSVIDFYKSLDVKSLTWIPVMSTEKELWGFITLSTTKNKKNWTEEDISLLKLISNQIYIAINQTELFKEKKQIADNEKTLRHIMLSSASLDYKKVINTIVTQAGGFFKADRCFYIGIDFKTVKHNPIEDYAEYLSSDKIRSHRTRQPNPGDTTKFIKGASRDSVHFVDDINQIDLPPETKKMLIDDLSVKSYLVVYACYDDIIYGSIVLHYVEDFKKFTQADIDMGKAIAHHAAIIIHQTKLYEAMQKTIERETILRKIIEITRDSLDENKVKKEIVDELGRAFKADRCYFRSYDKAQNTFSAPDVEYLSSPKIKSLLNVEPDQDGLRYFSGELGKRSQGFYPVVANEEIVKGTPLEAYMKSAEMKANYAMPIAENTEGFTWLVLHYSKEDPKLDDDYKKLLETIAFQVDTALNQIRLDSKTKQQAEREKAILSNLPFLAWLKDASGRFLAVNASYAQQCNTTIDEIVGKTDFDVHPKELAQMHIDDDIKVMQSGQQTNIEEKILGINGIQWYETFKTPVFDEEGQIIGTTGFSRDITERKEVDRIKNEFVAMVSHELRTPLTSIRGALGLIIGSSLSQGLADKAKDLLEIASNNSIRLINLINDILDIEKIEAGKMDFNIELEELIPIIEQSIQANLQFAQKFNVKLEFENSLDKVKVQVDKNRLMQVLTNLLSNAIKFSEQNSSVKISTARLDNIIRVSVTNYGAEIPLEFHNKIFQKFAQADSSDSRQKGGTGLGLSISKAIIEKLEGNLDFISENNETTFYFDLPEDTKNDTLIVATNDSKAQ